MGVIDRLWNGSRKQDALNALGAIFQKTDRNDPVLIFEELSKHLRNPTDLQLMNVDRGVADHDGHADVHFLVKGQLVKSVNSSELSSMAQAGTAGGLYNNHSVATGALREEDFRGSHDVPNEDGMRRYAEGRPGLGRFISTQRSLQDPPAHLESVNPGELDKVLIDLTPKQARSALVQTMEMLKAFYLNDVSHRDLHMHNLMVYRNDADPDLIAIKAIDFGKSEFGEGVSKKRGLDDLRYMFNQTAMGAWDSVIRSIREAAWSRAYLGETLIVTLGFASGGSVVADMVGHAVFAVMKPDVGAVAKHYPLHRLMAQVGAGAIAERASEQVRLQALLDRVDGGGVVGGGGVGGMGEGARGRVRLEALLDRVAKSDHYKELLANVGKKLCEDLQVAENPDPLHSDSRKNRIERAFQRATLTLDNAAHRLMNPPRPATAIRA